MDYDLLFVERTSYTVLDVLSDLGGIQSILISVIGLILAILNSNYLDDYLIFRLFKATPSILDPE